MLEDKYNAEMEKEEDIQYCIEELKVTAVSSDPLQNI
jgi:hypothetical protein